MAEVKCIWDAKALLGEGPTWVAHEEALYWVDILAPAIHRYHPQSQNKASWPMDQKIGCLVYKPNDGFLVGLQNGFARIEFTSPGEMPSVHHIEDPETEIPNNRFNDGKLDPLGRFWAGTMDDAERQKTGSWWVLDESDQVRMVDTGYQVTNGPAFDVKRNLVYLTDSAAQTIYRADLAASGEITNKQVFLQFKDGDGYPDGMTTDAAGNLWVAFWDGACIRKFDVDGKIRREIAMPVPRPTSIAFDKTGHKMYVTSARKDLSENDLKSFPLSGALFEVELK